MLVGERGAGASPRDQRANIQAGNSIAGAMPHATTVDPVIGGSVSFPFQALCLKSHGMHPR